MKTQIKKIGDTFVVCMEGKLNFEGQGKLKENLIDLLSASRELEKTDSTPHKVVFNFSNLEFVGSMGISSFVQTLKEFTDRSPERPRYCHVASEFQKVIKAYDEAHVFEFFSDEKTAIESFTHVPTAAMDPLEVAPAKMPSA